MGYRRMDMHVLKTILRRWIDGKSINRIHPEEGFDRKTICGYIAAIQARGLEPGSQIEEAELESVLSELLPANRRAQIKRELHEPYREEIVQLMSPDRGDAHRPEE